MKRIHPLDMPEIITLVGLCLPRWKYSDRLGFYDFNPTILLRCTLVNKTWREALLPVLWYVYDGFVMRSIPKQVITKNSRYFRVFFYDRSFSGPFECRHLKALAISWWDQSLQPLIEANAESLENLVWKGSSSTSPVLNTVLPTPDYGLLMRMSNTLEELQLSHWTLSGRTFVQFLSACKRLKLLSLTAIDWTDPAPFDPSFSSVSSPSSSTSSSPPWSPLSSSSLLPSSFAGSPQHYYPIGNGVTDLRLDISVFKEGAFVDLIRSCLNLVNFTLYSESGEDARTLTPILRRYCPRLSSIEYVLRFSSSLRGYDYMTDVEYADLVLSAQNLQSLKIDIPWLDDALSSALIMQSSTLTSLSLRFNARRDTPMKDTANICKLLRHCNQLRNLSLSFSPHALGRNETLQLLTEPWACVDLETLELTDVTMAMDPATPVHGPQAPPLQPYHWQLASTPRSMTMPTMTGPMHLPIDGSPSSRGGSGTAASAITAGGAGFRNGSLTKQRLFEQIRRLPKLKKLSLNHVTYNVDTTTGATGNSS
ncbi:hypothetical protein BX616_002279 [Lobosporangium transversale]|nr:hypothetical protein BX616_002279 [Lobosporangium transversale]